MKKNRLTSKIFGIVLAVVLVGAMPPLGAFGTHSRVEASPGTIYVPDDYSTIEAAVNASSPGDTIIVRDGTYIENVDVTKDHLTIESENGAETTIVQAANPNDDVFEVSADYVAINGLTVKGAIGGGYWASGIVLSRADYCNISDNNCSYNSYGIRLSASSNDILTNNAMSDNQFNFAVTNTPYPANYVHDIDTSNTVNGKPIQYLLDRDGLVIDSSWDVGYLGLVNCTNITVRDVTSSNNGQGVMLVSSSNCRMENLNVLNNTIGIYLFHSSNNSITNSTATLNAWYGVLLDHSPDNVLIENIASDNESGIRVDYSSNTILSSNTASGNGHGSGISLSWSPTCALTGNTMSHNEYGFGIGGDLPSLAQSIDTSNTVNGKPIQYLLNRDGLVIDSSWDVGYLALVNCTNVTVRDLTLTHNLEGLLLAYSNDSRIENVNVSDNWDGIYLNHSSGNAIVDNVASNNINGGITIGSSSENVLANNVASSNTWSGINLLYSSNNTVTSNVVTNRDRGIWLQFSSGNNLTGNVVSNNERGIDLHYSLGNLVYLNSFTDNTQSAHSYASANAWNSPEPITYTYNGSTYTGYLGNHWSDYEGRYPGAEEIDSTGIWNTPYGIDSDADNYPLMEPFENYERGRCGDVAPCPHCDGIVNMGDVVLLLNYVGHPGEYELCCDWCGDVAPCPASDGVINMGDVVLLLNYVGHPGEYQICCQCCDIYNLTISSTTGGSVTAPGEGTFSYKGGTVVSLMATPVSDCYRFARWTGDVGTIANVTAASTALTVYGNCSITASFEEEAITFPDPNLEAVIREAIGKPTGDIYCSDLEGLTYLDGHGRDIFDLTGLGHCTDLMSLNLRDNQISDISPLANLTSLTYLCLHFNQIGDVSSLANLTSLTDLRLAGNELGDISALTSLTSLTYLDLTMNQIGDVSPLTNLTSLAVLGLGTNQISDISPLANLTTLTRLQLAGNQISDISALANLATLTRLCVGFCQISDISPLANLTNLTELQLWHNQISDISSLANLTNLTQLELDSNLISDISLLANLTSLTWLSLGDNEISDISSLANLTALDNLYLLDNQISDISPLVQNQGLGTGDSVRLQGNPLSSDSINIYIPQLKARGVTVYY